VDRIGQQEVYDFLCKHRGEWFTSRDISERLGVSIGSVTMSLKKLRKTNLIAYENTGVRNTFRYMAETEQTTPTHEPLMPSDEIVVVADLPAVETEEVKVTFDAPPTILKPEKKRKPAKKAAKKAKTKKKAAKKPVKKTAKKKAKKPAKKAKTKKKAAKKTAKKKAAKRKPAKKPAKKAKTKKKTAKKPAKKPAKRKPAKKAKKAVKKPAKKPAKRKPAKKPAKGGFRGVLKRITRR